MTVYFSTSGAGEVALVVGANDIRIIGVELLDQSGTSNNGWFYVGQPGSSSASGGTVQAPYAAHQGAPASTVTARLAGASASGTFRVVGAYVLTSNIGSGTGGSYINSVTATWKPQGDLIIPAGGIFRRTGGAYTTVFWFEELRLSYGY